MSQQVQVIFDHGKPVFVVVPYRDYVALTGQELMTDEDDAELVPFQVSDFIGNSIKVCRIEAGISQGELAERLGVTQGYISKIERRGHKVTDRLMQRVKEALGKPEETE